MTAHVQIIEATGVGPAKQTAVVAPRLLANDVPSLSSNAKPVRLRSDGSPIYTCERWLRVRFTPPFGRVSEFRVWTPDTLPDGWALNFGTSPVYQPPATTPSVYAYARVPSADPGHTAPNAPGDAEVDADTGVQYSPWLVFQAILTGQGVDVSEQSLSFDFGWTES